jgi:hypothetical protein
VQGKNFFLLQLLIGIRSASRIYLSADLLGSLHVTAGQKNQNLIRILNFPRKPVKTTDSDSDSLQKKPRNSTVFLGGKVQGQASDFAGPVPKDLKAFVEIQSPHLRKSLSKLDTALLKLRFIVAK